LGERKRACLEKRERERERERKGERGQTFQFGVFYYFCTAVVYAGLLGSGWIYHPGISPLLPRLQLLFCSGVLLESERER
jgi:hypothetical protein